MSNKSSDPESEGHVGIAIGGEAMFQQSKAIRGRNIAQYVRAGEAQLGSISDDEAKWLAAAYECLKQIHAKRDDGQPGANAYCVFEVGEAYVQFLAPELSVDLVCEAASAKLNTSLAQILTKEKEDVLRSLGFDPVGISPNYSQRFEINGKDDLMYAARLAFQTFNDVYEVRNFRQSQFTMNVPEQGQNPAAI